MATATAAPPLTAEELFDDVGPAYEDAWANNKGQLASLSWLQSQLSARTPAKCLDIGCGTGRPVCSTLAEAGHHVLGIDVSGAMLEAARNKVPAATFEKRDIDSYDVPAETFDAVTIYFSLISDATQDMIRKTFVNAFRWLKPGGLFVFATVPFSADRMPFTWMGRSITVGGFDAEESVTFISGAGFEIVHQEVVTFKPKAAEVGLCKAEEVWEEPELFVYAKKPEA